jgi:hypothetical protein
MVSLPRAPSVLAVSPSQHRTVTVAVVIVAIVFVAIVFVAIIIVVAPALSSLGFAFRFRHGSQNLALSRFARDR